MQLVLDIGNTALKAGWFRGDELLETEILPEGAEFLRFEHPRFGLPDKAIVASVRASDPDWIREVPFPLIRMSPDLPLPIRNNYGTPQTLGMDRLASAVGGWNRYKEQDVLVIDAGTCLKFDLVTSDGSYQGGSIAPGLQMRFTAMHAYTGKLPLLAPEEEADLIGNDTNSSMQSGALNGMLAEIDGMILRYQKMYPSIHCLITGGDHPFFYHKLKSRIFAAPSLTLEGLNTILLHQK